MLDHFVYSAPWPSGISVYIKNAGYGPALNIRSGLKGGPSGLKIRMSNLEVGAGDTLDLGIYAIPISRDVLSSTPFFDDEISDYDGVLTIDITYSDTFGSAYISSFSFSIESGRVKRVIPPDSSDGA